MNRVILIGRLTKDPEIRTTNNGQSICRFTMAVDRRFKREGQATADFINIVSFGKQAEIIAQYFKKGNRIAIEGRSQTGSYTTNDGAKRYTTDVVLDNFDFIESKQRSKQGENKQPEEDIIDSDDDFEVTAYDDDLPF